MEFIELLGGIILRIGILNKITNPDIEKSAIPDDVEIVCLNANNETELCNGLSAFDSVIISYKFKLSRATIDKLINCKSIVCACVGYDNVDYLYAAKKGIKVFNVPDYGTNDVADHTMALLLSYTRRVVAYDTLLKTDAVSNWNPYLVSPFHRISDKQIGIIGLGRIGTAVALRAKAFGMSVSFYDPYKPNGYDKTFNFNKTESLLELIEGSDILTIHVPLNSETDGMIDWNIIKNAKRRPIIINTARGKIVDVSCICRALKEGIIDAFLTDVLEVEPPKETDELVLMQKQQKFANRIIITPHAASYAEESQYEMRYKAVRHAYMSIVNIDYKQDCINII